MQLHDARGKHVEVVLLLQVKESDPPGQVGVTVVLTATLGQGPGGPAVLGGKQLVVVVPLQVNDTAPDGQVPVLTLTNSVAQGPGAPSSPGGPGGPRRHV